MCCNVQPLHVSSGRILPGFGRKWQISDNSNVLSDSINVFTNNQDANVSSIHVTMFSQYTVSTSTVRCFYQNIVFLTPRIKHLKTRGIQYLFSL